MGYQEIVFKLDNPKKFLKNKKSIDNKIDTYFLNQISYDFIQFKEDLGEIKKGFYLLIYGDRNYGVNLVGALKCNFKLKSSYAVPIETALQLYTPVRENGKVVLDQFGSAVFEKTKYNEENRNTLKKLIKEKRNKTGNILMANTVYKQLERELVK